MDHLNVSLAVGGTVKLKKAVFSAGIALTYAGMVSDTVYSVVIHWTQGNQAMAWNLYHPIDHRGFDLADGHVTVTHVDCDSMRLVYEKGK